MDIIIAIKNEAQKQKTSLAKIARKLDMTPQNFNNILKPDSVKFDIVQQVAKILNVSIGYLNGECPTFNSEVILAHEPPAEYGNAWKDKYMTMLEENRELRIELRELDKKTAAKGSGASAAPTGTGGA